MDKSKDVSSSDYCLEHRAIPIVKAVGNHRFELDATLLEKVLLQEHIKDKNVVVVSIAGAFRKGKSFMLDFFLRYLRSKYVACDISEDWLGPADAPLVGFSWRGGAERETSGILIWSEVFLAELPTKGEVAILLMDTQGTFDSESTVRECATVFALSTMISSVQVYNLSQNIQEDDLQHLQLFTEYGRLVLADSGRKPFQKLCFLIRDWCYPYDADYGETGGKKILERRLKLSDKQHPELKSVREHIYSCFSDISCFLMPHPGLKVATNPKFNGRLFDIERDFIDALKIFAPRLLAPENLIMKEINGNQIKAKELLYYFASYMNVYSGDELPEPKSMLAATAEANNLSAMSAAKDSYSSMMEDVCGGTKPYLCSNLLERQHTISKGRALEMFSSKKKMGGAEFSEAFLNQLDKEIDDLYERFQRHNESKNLFKYTRTPAVCFCVIVLLYSVSGVFGLFGLYYLANLTNFLMGILIGTIIFWSYIRYSGEFIHFGECIDNAALIAWTDIMRPTFDASVELLKNRSFSQIK